MFYIRSPMAIMVGQEHELSFRIEVWDDADSHVDELVALVGDHGVAIAAFTETARRRPGRIVTLRQRARILADTRRVQDEA